MVNVNQLMSLLDDKLQNELKYNVLYYNAAFTLKSLFRKLECGHCKDKLSLDVEDDIVFQMATYPVFAKLTCVKQIHSLVLVFPSPAVLKIVKATEMVFKQRVLDEGKGINYKQKLDLKITISSSWASWTTDLQGHLCTIFWTQHWCGK